MEKNRQEKTTGVDSVEQGFLDEPRLTPIEEIEAESYAVSSGELKHDMEDAGIEAPERPRKAEIPLEETGVGQVETGFLEKSPLSMLAAASAGPGVSPHELKHQLEEVGVKVPGKPVKPAKEKKKHSNHSGVDSVEEGFLAEPEMSPVEELGAIRYAASPEEIHQEVEKVEGKEHILLNEALLSKLQEAGYTGDLEALRKIAADLKE